MPRICKVTGKRHTRGNNKSHANNHTRRSFLPNIQRKRIWDADNNRWVSLRISTKGLRIIDKLGLTAVLEKIRARELLK